MNMKAVMSASIDVKILEEFQKRVKKNERSEWVEQRMREFIDHNRYELEKTQRELEDTEATARMLRSQIEDMKEARKQETLAQDAFEDDWYSVKGNVRSGIYLQVKANGVDGFMKQSGDFYAKRYGWSIDELKTAILDKMKGENQS